MWIVHGLLTVLTEANVGINFSVAGIGALLDGYVKAIAVGALDSCITRSSAAMASTLWHIKIFYVTGKFLTDCVIPMSINGRI